MQKIDTTLFQPGQLSKDGFLGDDDRPIEEIILEDQRSLSRFGTDAAGLARRLQRILDWGKNRLDDTLELPTATIRVQWDRGMLPCPFGDSGLHPKITVEIRFKNTGKSLRFSQLSLHLLRKHGFFGGRGSAFRLEPEECTRIDVPPDFSTPNS